MTVRTKLRTPSAPAGKWLIGALPLALGAMLWAAYTRSTRSAVSPSVAMALGSKPNAPPEPPRLNGAQTLAGGLLPAGSERNYRASYRTHVNAENGVRLVSFAMVGELVLAGLASEGGRIIGAQFHGEMTVADAADPGSQGARALDEAVQRPFFLVFSNDGRFREARGAAGLPVFVGRMWQALGEYLQVVREPGESWQASESDASGNYLAEYKLSGDTLFKQKSGYPSLTAKHLKSYDVRQSDEQFRFDNPPALRAVALKEGLTAIAVDGPFATFDSNTELELEATTPLHPSVNATFAGLVAQAKALKTNGSQDPAAYDRARAGGLSVAEAYARLGEIKADDKGRRDRAERAFVALTALLRQDPKNLALLASKLAKDGPLTEPLLAALRDASTPESQALLAKMAAPDSPLSAENRLEAARSLSRVPTPTAQTVEALKSLRSDATVGVQATYGLGSALHRLENQDPALAESTRDALSTQLDQAQTPAQQAAVLTALGNAGSGAMLEKIRGYISNPSSAVRSAAAQALRRIPGAEPDGMLAALSRDPVADVRWNAVDAISERELSPVLAAALSERALGETEFAIRSRAINALSAWLPQDASIAGTLRLVAERDPSQDLRTVATNALAKLGP